MSMPQELFRFVSLRKPERTSAARLSSRLIRDLRPAGPGSLLQRLMGDGNFAERLQEAHAFAASPDFVRSNDVNILMLDSVAEFLRIELQPGVGLADLAAAFKAKYPLLSGLLARTPKRGLAGEVAELTGRLWDSLYTRIIQGCDRYTSTNYLVDALRVYHVLRIWWLSNKLGLNVWPGGTFDEYHILIDLGRLQQDDGNGPLPGTISAHEMETLAEELTRLDDGLNMLQQAVRADWLEARPEVSQSEPVLNKSGIRNLKDQPALADIDLAKTPVNQIMRQVQARRQEAAMRLQRLQMTDATQRSRELFRQSASNALTASEPVNTATADSQPFFSTAKPRFRVPLSVGDLPPPVVGDLLLVEQELQRYVPNEIADIENIMMGERKEHSTRDLSRTTQTTTTETSTESEQTTSTRTEERFKFSSEAQKAATQSLSVSAGVSVSGKFGPVQVGVTANASYDTSKSSSESTSQEFAKTVTEEASQRVKESFKQTTSLTLLTESLKTSLHGFNNEKGSGHAIGIYRWVDKIYIARLMNYGRRLMLEFSVPEPAAFFRSLLEQDEAALLDGLTEPVHPSRLEQSSLEEMEEGGGGAPLDRYTDITENNYAQLAAMYDVTDIVPPPPNMISGAKAISYPEAYQSEEPVKEHSDEVSELSLVWADNTLSVDPNYQLDKIGVYAATDKAATGENDKFQWYANNLKLGQSKENLNVILVEVGDKSFYFYATGQGPNDPVSIRTNFNELQSAVDTQEHDNFLNGSLQTALPIAINADFEGILNLNVVYTANLRQEALDAWKAQTYSAIIKGYQRKKQEYDQALELAKSKVQTETEETTFQLREEQYRSIENTELKRGCIDLLSQGTAPGYTSIEPGDDGSVKIIYNEADSAAPGKWRSPLANGAVASFFETAFDWDQITYQLFPYYWTDSGRWKDLLNTSSADLQFEQFQRAGMASVVAPVKPGYERPVLFFLKTGLTWAGGYLPLFVDTSEDEQEMLEVYADVELGLQFDPPLQVGESWEVRLPTSLVMLQESSTLPVFEVDGAEPPITAPDVEEPVPDQNVPF